MSPGFLKIGLKDEFNASSHNKIGTAELAELIASLLVLYFFISAVVLPSAPGEG